MGRKAWQALETQQPYPHHALPKHLSRVARGPRVAGTQRRHDLPAGLTTPVQIQDAPLTNILGVAARPTEERCVAPPSELTVPLSVVRSP